LVRNFFDRKIFFKIQTFCIIKCKYLVTRCLKDVVINSVVLVKWRKWIFLLKSDAKIKKKRGGKTIPVSFPIPN